MMSTVLGNITLQHVRRHSQLNLDYAGGGFFYRRRVEGDFNGDSLTNGMLHRASLFQAFTSARWKFLLGDNFLYLPESPFGFAGFGGLESFGGGMGGPSFAAAPALNPMFAPNQTIVTGRGERYSNVVMTELQYQPGARSALTATGAFGSLNFLDPAFIDSRYWALLVGYNFAATRRDVFAITYAHYLFELDVGNQGILNRGFLLAYGHQITGRLSLELSAGAMANDIAKPLGGAVTRSFVTTYDSLHYSFRSGTVGISFMRYMTGGAGLLAGAESRVAQFSAGRQLWRKGRVRLTVGHAYNQSLTRESEFVRRSRYETWHGGAMVSRELGQHVSLYMNYSVQRQISDVPLCFGNNCGTVILRHVGGLGINWHSRPIRLP
jgi:hypothetical protein